MTLFGLKIFLMVLIYRQLYISLYTVDYIRDISVISIYDMKDIILLIIDDNLNFNT